MEKSQALPKHLGFIVDGNRRWARERNLPTLEGHRRGFNQVEKIAEASVEKGIEFTSFYLFSTENWGRSKEEVSYLMDLVRTNVVGLIKKFKKKNIRCVILGRPEPVDPDIWQKLMEAEKDTKDCTAGTICICFNYGGQQEIADAATKLITSGHTGEVTIEDIASRIYHPEVPPVDMIIRTSGEERISGFMLWRAAYSEFLFLEKYFPDIKVSDLDNIVEEYNSRGRRFGK